MMLQLQQLSVPPGQRLLLNNISWAALETILDELGEHRNTRIAYSNGTLELMTPLPEHERAKVILGDLVKALLDELDRDWESLGSTTFKREAMAAGIEPDDCFYIQNYSRVIGQEKLDFNIDPAPDLAIEVDVTSQTQVSAYAALGVPEIWCYRNRQLQINLLETDQYIRSQNSLAFPSIPIIKGISTFSEMSRTQGPRQTLKAFRAWVRQQP
ncbi:MAG: Uma2 family endonuclease [Thermosynechococcaceae cyanobacterium]